MSKAWLIFCEWEMGLLGLWLFWRHNFVDAAIALTLAALFEELRKWRKL